MDNYVIWTPSDAEKAGLAERCQFDKAAQQMEFRMKPRGVMPALEFGVERIINRPTSVTVELWVRYRLAFIASGGTAEGNFTIAAEARTQDVAIRDVIANVAEAVWQRVVATSGARVLA